MDAFSGVIKCEVLIVVLQRIVMGRGVQTERLAWLLAVGADMASDRNNSPDKHREAQNKNCKE
jgi:hypothetical protein